MSRVISAPWIGTVLHTPYILTSWLAVISLYTLFIKCTSAVPSMAPWVLHLSTNLFCSVLFHKPYNLVIGLRNIFRALLSVSQWLFKIRSKLSNIPLHKNSWDSTECTMLFISISLTQSPDRLIHTIWINPFVSLIIV